MIRYAQMLCLIFLVGNLSAQVITQKIRGTIKDQQSEVPLVGAKIMTLDTESPLGAISDERGEFILENVPVGRRQLQVSYVGYEPLTVPNILVTAGKIVALDLMMQESVLEMDEVVISGSSNKAQTENELATVSARSFNLDEVRRFAGSRTDVARMASNYAGVSTPDDSRNDIVIRGNSPTALLWRLEGIPIPNPNHFATLGTTGGPVSALNPNLLKNSDFLTGAFPAEYGNVYGGVFDLSFRKGNPDEYEFMAQLGAFSGLEFLAEGPIDREKRSSFLVGYRYSFVELANTLGIPIGTEATPQYSDLAFNVDFGYSKWGNFSIFGLGGVSSIDFLAEDIEEDDLFAEQDENAFPRSQLGTVGLKHNLLLGSNAYIRTIIATSLERAEYTEDQLLDDGSTLQTVESETRNVRSAISSYYNKKFTSRLTLRTGIIAEFNSFDIFTQDRDDRPDSDGDGIPDFVTVRDFDGNLNLFQTFVQSQYYLTPKLILNAGIHAQYLEFNDDWAVEPRLALNWKFAPNQTLSIAYGLHNQTQPAPIYFFSEEVEQGTFSNTNKDLAFTRSNHFVLAYDLLPSQAWRIKAEAYYQSIDRAPVDPFPSSFSVLNEGNDFDFTERGSLVNEGTGENYGIELTLEKFFSRGYYGLITTSIYNSRYEGSDGIERNTAFNNNYILNVLFGKEWKIGKTKQNALTFDMRLANAGGRYYTPIDLEATRANFGREVFDRENAFSLQNDPYFRLDTKFGIRLNSKKRNISQQFYIDFQNVTNQENIFIRRYNSSRDEIVESNQIGFFPDILYRLEF